MTPSRALKNRASRALLAVALAALCSGCAVGRYARDRALDFIDIFDIKYGTCVGVGAKVEITHFLGAGAGVAGLGPQREWYGRRSIKSKGFAFAHAGAIGVDGGYGSPNPNGWSDEPADIYFLLVNGTALGDFLNAPGGDARIDDLDPYKRTERSELPDEPDFPPTPPLRTRWRVGFEALVLAVDFGLYINFGELADFLIGFTTIDIADDDGIGKGELYPQRPRSTAVDMTVY